MAGEGDDGDDGAQRPRRERDAQDGGEAGSLLGEMATLRRRARSARHAYWFPLVLFGLLTCVAAPLYLRQPARVAATAVTLRGVVPQRVLGGAPTGPAPSYRAYYWIVALLGGVLLTLLWYRRHARRTGLATPALGYVIVTAVLTAVTALLPFLPGGWAVVALPGDLTIRGTFPFLIIAAGLAVLARAERSRALGVVAVVYAGTAVLTSLYDVVNVLARLGWNPVVGRWDLSAIPNVLLPAVVLLAGGAGAFAAQRRRARAERAGAGSA